MPRAFTEHRIIVASHNPGKVREIRNLLSPLGIKVQAADELGLIEPEETGKTFLENAALKARAAATASGIAALADDSGLCVDALQGAPGIYSARWAGPDKDFALAMAEIERKLDGAPSAAHFTCALSLAWPDGHVENVEGIIEGRLRFPPKGTRGFGYDPIFVPHGYDISFGEMNPENKLAINHRAIAFKKMLKACFDHAN
ncbi:non-canonical purine NTP pyrophosphatase [Iodidimonas muriae]|uniref:dITP/XTP pyrophosphatase n=1 Tax=Iodidimonas muriae TaxID=261467 RepID=A0ABQ2L987_9PROT|nr:RdgB/HAM1 family non-canonical purine NTP pyrophosphatase [Iodidimonas muriae]GER05934.1 non-canonical purine NTP pyrophosphatase [Kordiimonadales bacterium JCM 17843]GGO07485.1 non-canonical purine NTP pyrophosphatase [Iodidimonas muriae]